MSHYARSTQGQTSPGAGPEASDAGRRKPAIGPDAIDVHIGRLQLRHFLMDQQAKHPASETVSDRSRFPDQELWEPAAKIGGVPRDEPLPVHCETTDQNIGNRAFRHFVGTPALHI